MLLEPRKIVLDFDRWVFERLPQPLKGGEYAGRRKIEQMGQKLIGVLDLDAVRCDRFFRKILQVVSHDDVRTATNGSRQHVTIIWIGQGERGDQVLEVVDECIPGVRVHEIARSFQLRSSEVRSVRKD